MQPTEIDVHDVVGLLCSARLSTFVLSLILRGASNSKSCSFSPQNKKKIFPLRLSSINETVSNEQSHQRLNEQNLAI